VGLARRTSLPTSTGTALECPICNRSGTKLWFEAIVDDGPYRASGNTTSRRIYRCGACGHVTVDAYDPGAYQEYYSSLQNSYYDVHDIDSARYRRVAEACRGAKRVLDFGCGVGTFLDLLPPEVEKYGIEPSLWAASEASRKGITILSNNDLHDRELRGAFDAITAIDVIEHTQRLCELRDLFAGLLCPGGVLVLLTGALDSRAARSVGRFWNYLHCAEHVSFFSADSMHTWLEPRFANIEIQRTEHHPLSGREFVLLARAWALFPVKWAIRKSQLSDLRMTVALPVVRDHMLVRAQRRAARREDYRGF
jgi:SAM-dependent methyltransferase